MQKSTLFCRELWKYKNVTQAGRGQFINTSSSSTPILGNLAIGTNWDLWKKGSGKSHESVVISTQINQLRLMMSADKPISLRYPRKHKNTIKSQRKGLL